MQARRNQEALPFPSPSHTPWCVSAGHICHLPSFFLGGYPSAADTSADADYSLSSLSFLRTYPISLVPKNLAPFAFSVHLCPSALFNFILPFLFFAPFMFPSFPCYPPPPRLITTYPLPLISFHASPSHSSSPLSLHARLPSLCLLPLPLSL